MVQQVSISFLSLCKICSKYPANSFLSFKINAQCISGEIEIDFVASGVSGGWSDYAVLMGSSSSYLINTPGSNLECINNGLCYIVSLTGSAILEIYQAGSLVATPTNGDTVCFPFVASNPGCIAIIDTEAQHLKADGSAWFVNPGNLHSAWNMGETDDIRLIVACNGQDDLI